MRAVKCYIILFLVSILFAFPAPAQQPVRGEHQSVGLVLSGGGAKGIAHIGAIKALEDNGIPIDYVSGTSMGAIVGGLYACGYTPEEMMALITSDYFGYLSTGKIDPEFVYYFSQERPSPQMFSFPLGRRDSTEAMRFNPQSLISPIPMSFGFMEIFSAYTAQCRGDFNKLFVPFRCVASDMTKRSKAVFGHGDLAESIRASMSFPLVFQAVKMGDNIYYDGGIYDNFPVDVMQNEFAPAQIIGISVSTPSDKPNNSYLDQLDMLVSAPQSYEVPEKDGIKVHIKLTDFGLLDFGAAKAIYQRGYDRTMEMMDSIKARIGTRVSVESRNLLREMFKSRTPALRFSEVEVSGGTKRQNDYIRFLFNPKEPADTIGIDRARLAYYRAVSSDKISTMMPRATLLNDTSELFRLSIETTMKNRFDVGVGAYITSSNNSYLYVRAGYSTMSFSSVNTNIEAWVGQSYMAGAFSGSIYLSTRVPSAFRFLAVASRNRFYETEKLFFRDNEPTFVVNHDYFGRVAWAMAAGRTASVDVGVGGGREYNTFYRNNDAVSYAAGRDRLALDLGQIYAGYSSSTLDNLNFPTSGYSRNGKAMAVAGRSVYHRTSADSPVQRIDHSRNWLQVDWHERDYLNLSKHWSLGLEGRAVLSTRGLLDSYYATISSAPAFTPTPASNNVFDPKLRANSFIAVGAVPVYKYNNLLSARLSLNAFTPLRAITEGTDGTAKYGKWFGSMQFFGEFNVVYALPFADLSAYCNYATSSRRCNVGISLGFYIKAPSFL